MKSHWYGYATWATSMASLGAGAPNVLDLSSLNWTLNNSKISVPAKVPSQAHLDLHEANAIGDPLWGLGDFDLRWVANSNWTYRVDDLSKHLKSDYASTWLLFNGLDTITTVDFCGQQIATTNNQFRQYYFDVTEVLKNCKSDSLSLHFGSAPEYANRTAELPNQETWPWGVQGLFEFPNRQFIRKEQNDFGWDWGPAFAPAGPWQKLWIIQLQEEDAYVRNTLVDIYRVGQVPLVPPNQSRDWVLNVSIDYLGSLAQDDTRLVYRLSDFQNKTIKTGRIHHNVSGSAITGHTIVPASLVDLWWPVGLGPQNLYLLTVEVRNFDGRPVLHVEKRVGFRTIVLNEWPVTEAQKAKGIAPGNNWHFEINGHQFFAKGSNFIPPDPFWPTVNESRMRQLLESVVDGNQNMLRVWSSGAYSPDFMYDLADEMGILLWSEFEFGDALYPVDQPFLDNVREEVHYQVRRVNHHPSLAFWAGGNELENLELWIVNETAPELLDRYTAEYETLFLKTIVPPLFANSRSISYSPSSTTNGWLELDFSKEVPIVERYHNLTPGSIYGDTDHYDYNSAHSFNLSTYPVGRFANEFGYHSMPSLQTWRQAVPPEDLWFNSTTITLRNHHYPAGGLMTDNIRNASMGMAEMTIAAQRWYPVPNKTNSLANFSAWCHTTQIFQADYYKSQIEFYRLGSALPQRTLGSLYWQLEDQWQAPTWAGIEYDGRWKVLHYIAKDAYQPVIVSPSFNVDTHELDVWVISDLWSSIDASVQLVWYDWSGKRLNVSFPPPNELSAIAATTVGPINGTKVCTGNIDQFLNRFDLTNIVLKLDVSATGRLPNSNNMTSRFRHTNWFHPAPLSQAKFVDPGLKIFHNEKTCAFTVRATKGVAAWVWLDYPSGAVVTFDTNGFWLALGETKTITYKVKMDETNGTWIGGVTVRSLWDNIQPSGNVTHW